QTTFPVGFTASASGSSVTVTDSIPGDQSVSTFAVNTSNNAGIFDWGAGVTTGTLGTNACSSTTAGTFATSSSTTTLASNVASADRTNGDLSASAVSVVGLSLSGFSCGGVTAGTSGTNTCPSNTAGTFATDLSTTNLASNVATALGLCPPTVGVIASPSANTVT